MERNIYKKLGLLTFFYAILVFAGGATGFFMKHSVPSLVTGSLSGLTLLYLSVKTMTFHRWSLVSSLILILALDTFFSYRYLTSKHLFPAGIMLLITSLVLLFMILQLNKLKLKQKEQK